MNNYHAIRYYITYANEIVSLNNAEVHASNSSARKPATMVEVLRSFLSPSVRNSGTVPHVGHDCFLPHPFQFIIILAFHAIESELLRASLNIP
jgi:hypothetical protein